MVFQAHSLGARVIIVPELVQNRSLDFLLKTCPSPSFPHLRGWQLYPSSYSGQKPRVSLDLLPSHPLSILAASLLILSSKHIWTLTASHLWHCHLPGLRGTRDDSRVWADSATNTHTVKVLWGLPAAHSPHHCFPAHPLECSNLFSNFSLLSLSCPLLF